MLIRSRRNIAGRLAGVLTVVMVVVLGAPASGAYADAARAADVQAPGSVSISVQDASGADVEIVDLVAMVSSAKSASHIPDDQFVVNGEHFELAELIDIRFVSELENVSFEERLRLTIQKRHISQIDQRLAEMYPEAYSGGAIEDNGRRGWIAFSEAVPPLAAELASAANVPIELLGNTGFTEAEITAALEANYYTVYRRSDIGQASGSYDVKTGAIEIVAEPAEPNLSDAELLALRDDIALSARSEPPVTVKIVVDYAAETSLRSHIGGGGHLRNATNAHVCTAGFSVYNASNPSQYGITTAGHCARVWSGLYYTPHDCSSCRYFTTRRSGYTLPNTIRGRDWGDQAWYLSSSHNTSRVFYYNWNATRNVSTLGALRPTLGTDICRFGAVSGADCGEVDERSSCNLGYCQLVKMRMSRGAGGQFANGDSGGPWYWGGTAYGITSAGSAVGWPNHNVGYYTPTQLFRDALGVIVIR